MSAKKKKTAAQEVDDALDCLRETAASIGGLTITAGGRSVTLGDGARKRLKGEPPGEAPADEGTLPIPGTEPAAAPEDKEAPAKKKRPAPFRTAGLFPGDDPPSDEGDEDDLEHDPSAPLPGQRRLKIRAGAAYIKMASLELHRALSALQHAAAEVGDERPHLSAVHIHASDEVVFHATNGHWMARWTCEVEELPDHPVAMLVAIADVHRLLPLLKADAKDMNVVCLNFDDGVASLTDGTILPLQKIDIGMAPPYDTVWPRGEPSGCPVIGWTPTLMAKAMRCFKAAYGDHVVARVQLRGPLDGLLLRADAKEELQVVLMPARLSDQPVDEPTAPPVLSKDDGEVP